MVHFYVRRFLAWFCGKTNQQCSGKRRVGYANEYCRKSAFHNDTCMTFSGERF